MNFNFGWGTPEATKDAMTDSGVFSMISSGEGSEYLPHSLPFGELEKLVQGRLLKIGLDYTVSICPGALYGVSLLSKMLSETVGYDEKFFRYYSTALKGSPEPFSDKVFVTASPSNPEGIIQVSGGNNTIWDAAYHSTPYCHDLKKYPEHKAVVGSFGKITGLAGIRLGYVASKDQALVSDFYETMIQQTMGYSAFSYRVATDFLSNKNFETAETRAQNYIDDNREEFQKLEYLMDEGKVPENGMFLWGVPSSALLAYTNQLGATFISGETCGGTERHSRISLGRNRSVTKEFVKKVRGLDGV